MANEKHDPWYLLAAARGSVLQHKERLLDCDHDAETCTCDLAAQKIALLARIDAALAEGCPDCGHPYGQQDYCQGDGHAERADSAKDVVEWEERQGSYIHDDGVNELRVYLWGDQWHWHTVVEYRANGICTTEAEARRAATAAARGMR
jgi:hypothetical protein